MPEQSFVIEYATLEDCEDCANLLVVQLAEHHVFVSREDLLPILERVVADPAVGFLLVARVSGKIVGVAYAATLLTAEHCGFISSLEELYVVPEWRKKGVGSALLRGVFERTKQNQMRAIILEVDTAHNSVIALYQKFGFRRLDRSRWVAEI